MPTDTASTTDIETLERVVSWSIAYFLDPKRGAGKNLPTLKELQSQFPNSNLVSIDQITNWIQNKLGIKDLNEILSDTQRLEGVANELNKREIKNDSFVPRNIPAPSKGHVSALGVLAEIETIEPILKKHRQETAAQLTTTLEEKTQEILPKVGVKGLSKDQIKQVSAEIAVESAQEIVQEIAKIQHVEEIPRVIADSLTQSILAHPQLEGKVQMPEEKIFQKLEKTANVVSQSHQENLTKVATLASIVQIASLEKPNNDTSSLVKTTVDRVVETHSPLASQGVNQAVYGHASAFLQNYAQSFKSQIAPQISGGDIPTFSSLQKVKSSAFSASKASLEKNFTKYKGEADPTDLTNRLGFILGLDSSLSTPNLKGPLAQGFNARAFRISQMGKRGKEEFFNSSLGHNKDWLKKNYSQLETQIQNFKKQKSLTFSQRKEYLLIQKQLANIGRTLSFTSQNQQRAQNWLILAQAAAAQTPSPGASSTYIYQSALSTVEAASGYYPGVFAPKSLSANPLYLARMNLAGLSPRMGLGDVFGSVKSSFLTEPQRGMGISKVLLNGPQGLALSIGRKIRNISAAVFGGLGLYFLSLGMAALKGFIIGAIAGMATGLGLGIGVCVALGPIGIIAAPVVIPLAMITGGIIGGTGGGLIAFGLSQGSTTAATTGIGVTAGGTTGAIIGGTLGSVFGPLGTLAGAVIGGYVGAFVGGVIGYAIGHYVIGTLGAQLSGALAGASIGFMIGGPVGGLIGAGIGWLATGGFTTIKSFFSGGASATASVGAGALGAIGSFFTGAASAIWGGIGSAAGGALSFLSGATSFLGSLGSLAIPTSVATVPVLTAFGAVGIGTTIVGIVTATAFFSPEKDQGALGTGDNTYFTVKKTASPDRLENSTVQGAGGKVTFAISLTAKDLKLTQISVSDKMTADGKNIHTEITQNENGQPLLSSCTMPQNNELAAKATWSCNFSILIKNDSNHDFADSTITNTVTVTAIPEGKAGLSDSASAFVIIGTPPSDCPRGWPTAHGAITQGIQGIPTHINLYPQGQQAIDIGGNSNHEETFSTFTGKVFATDPSNSGNYGNYVDLQGICQGKPFRVRYAHLLSIDSQITPSSNVTIGQKIGRIDSTGLSTGDHLHYAFFELDMKEPYIPKNPSSATCSSASDCGVSW